MLTNVFRALINNLL